MRGLTTWLEECRHAWRAVRRRPLVSIVAAASLALGLGLAMLTLTIVDAILVRPLPFPRSHELLTLYSTFRPESGADFPRSALSAPEILDYAAQSQMVDAGAFRPQAVAFADGDAAPERLPATRMTSAAFRVLDTPPAIGRVVTEGDDRPGAPCVAILSHGLWQERFAAAIDVLSRTVRIDGQPCAIAGVMPPNFSFPNQAARLWLPLAVDPDPNDRGSHGLVAVGRLRPGVQFDEAVQELGVMMARWAASMPHHKGHSVVIAPYKDDLVGPVGQELRILAGAVALLVVAIAANLSSLLLAHGSARRRELAVRAALGASRASLVRQLVWEGWLLAGAGGVAGSVLAWLSLRPVLAAYPAALPRANEVHIDWRTLGLALAISLVVGTFVALLPAIRLTRRFAAADLNTADRRGGLSLSLRTERVLVVAELAISVTVAVGALLLTQSFAALSRVPIGFDSTNVTAATVGVPAPGRPAGWAQQFFGDLVARLDATPGIDTAGAISSVPMVNAPPPDLFTIEGRPVPRPSQPGLIADYVMVTPGTFETLSIDVLRGRGITAADTATSVTVAAVNETFARRHWPSADPIGQRIRYPQGVQGDAWSGWGPWITIVGIVRDIRSIAPAMPARPAIYVAHAQLPRSAYDGRTMGVLLRANANVDVASLLRTRIRELDGNASVSAIRTMDAIVGAAVARPRFMGGIMAVFAAIALAVAALGVYGVVAYGVERRSREIGVKLALGASRTQIAASIGRNTLAMLTVGLLLGLAGAALLAQNLRTMLFGVTPFGVAPYVTVAAVLAIAVVAAAALPTRRATRVDPLIALRME